MIEIIKNFLRPIKLNYLMFSRGFYLKRENTGLYLCKKGDAGKIPVIGGLYFTEHIQVIDLMDLYDYIMDKKIQIGRNTMEIRGLNGIDLILARDPAGFMVGPTILFYSHDSVTSKLGKFGSELYGYVKNRDVLENDVVFDCGACYGWFAIYAAKKAKKGHVYCFEPDASNIKLLEENLRLNGLKNVTIVPAVVMGKSGTVKFYETGTEASKIIEQGENLESPTALYSKSSGVREVLAVSLEDFCAKEKIQRINFLKMDIEGSEYEVIKTAKEFIKNSVEYFAIASYHVIEGKSTAELMEPILRSLGFKVETGYPTHPTTYGWRPESDKP